MSFFHLPFSFTFFLYPAASVIMSFTPYKACTLGGRITDTVITTRRLGFITKNVVYTTSFTLSGSQVKGGFITHDNVDNNDRMVTIPGVAELESAYENLQDGFTSPFLVVEASSKCTTIAPGLGVTSIGDMEVDGPSVGVFWFRRADSTSWTVNRVS